MFDHCVLELNFVQGDARINAVLLVHVQDWYTGQTLADSFRLIFIPWLGGWLRAG